MNIISKLKKIVIGTGMAVVTLPSKIFATLLGAPTGISILYGIPKPSTTDIISTIAKILIIPIALIIGLIVCFIKNKNFKIKRAIVIIGLVIILIALFFVLNYLYSENIL